MAEGVAGSGRRATRAAVPSLPRALASERIRWGAAMLALWGASGGCLALFTRRISDWAVMTDELQYAKLATAIGGTGSPLPRLHEESAAAFNQLYPLLIAPFYGLMAGPDAFRAAHVLGAFVMASAAIPVYLMARQVLPRTWSFAVALLSVLVPWMIVTGFLMTEVAAYPAFLWAALATERAVGAPSARRDLLVLASLVLAFAARSQFAVLALVVPLAVLVHELGRAGDRSAARALRVAVSSALARHRVLAWTYATGAVVVCILVVVRSAGSLLGSYSVTVDDGSPLPSGVWLGALQRIDAVGIGCGVAPLLLGGGWLLAATVRPRSDDERALASVGLVTVLLLALEVASFDLRFGEGIVRDRYLFYVAPFLFVGSAAALRSGPRRELVAGIALVTVMFASTVRGLEFPVVDGISVDSPPRILNGVLDDSSGHLGLGTGTGVAVAGAALGVILIAWLLAGRATQLAVVLFVALLVFSVTTLRSEIDRVVAGTSLAGRPLVDSLGSELDWVDDALPPDSRAALVPFPVSTSWDVSALGWWDLEFWNRSVVRTYVTQQGRYTYTPFPTRRLALDWDTGRIRGTADAPPYVVLAANDPRLGLAGAERARRRGFRVIAAGTPYRAAWATQGLQADGWTRPDRPATVRVYGGRSTRPALVHLDLTLLAPDSPARYWLSTGRATAEATLEPGQARQEEVTLCVPARSYAQVIVLGWSRARIPGPPLAPGPRPSRKVGVGLTSVDVTPARHDCGRLRG